MVDDDGGAAPRRRPGIWEAVVMLVLAAIVLAGLALVADGLYLKTRALASQVIQERGTVFHKLADGR